MTYRAPAIVRSAAFVSALAAIVAAGTPVLAATLSPSEQRGQTLARANCSRCHSIDKLTPSPLAIAPPFRTLHTRYPVDSLEEALAQGIVTGHANMPEFVFDPDQIGDFIAFLKTLER